MGIVHHHQRAACAADAIHAAGGGADLREHAQYVGQRIAFDAQKADAGSEVLRIEPPQEPAVDFAAAPRRIKNYLHALGGSGKAGDADIGLFIEAVAVHVQVWAVGTQPGGQIAAEFVVRIDDGVLKALPIEQFGLAGAIGGHAAMVIEVVAGEVGEDGGGEGRADHAVLVEAVAGHFHRHGFCALLFELVQQGLHAHGVGRGVGGFFEPPPEAVAHRADDGAGRAEQIGGLGKPLRNRGFAVGAGYPPARKAT